MELTKPFELHHRQIATLAPSLRYDGSEPFAEWQVRARKKLSELVGLHRIQKASDDAFTLISDTVVGNHRDIFFTIQSEEGYTVPCHLWIPQGTERAPLVVCLQGHSTGMHISMGIPIYEQDKQTIAGGDRDFAVQIMREGYCALVVEQRCMGMCGGAAEKTGTSGCQMPALTALLYGRTVIGERVFDISCAISAVLRHFDVAEADKICCMGNSGGGTATIYAAALDERIALAMPSCALCTYRDSIAAMPHCACNYVPHIAEYFDMGDLCGLIAPRKVLVVNGAHDPIFPKAGVQECLRILEDYYAAAGVPSFYDHVEGTQGHRFYAVPSWDRFRALLNR